MHYPIIWNDLSQWKFSFFVDKTQLFLLYRHVILFRYLSRDWSGNEYTDLAHFVPSKYSLKFVFTDFELFCNVNEKNVVEKINDINENGKELECKCLFFRISI